MTLQTYELIAKTLAHEGHDTIFGLLGSGNFLFTDSFAREHDGRFLWVRHEAAAVAAAAAYSQVTGRVGIASVHQGPGVTNTLTTLVHAVRERQPVVLLAGETARGITVNQTIDMRAFATAAGVPYRQVVDAAGAAAVVSDALAIARRDRSPVIIGVPTDVQKQKADWVVPGPHRSQNNPRSLPSHKDIEQAADMIMASERPLILAGRGAVEANARAAIEDLGERIGAFYATSLVSNGFFAGNPNSLGVCGGFSSKLTEKIVPEADVVLAFGATLNQWTSMHGRLIDHSTVVQCDEDPRAFGSYAPVRLALLGDARETALALTAELKRRGYRSTGFRGTEFEEQLREYIAAEDFEPVVNEGTLDPRSLAVALDRAVPEARTVTYDSGHFHWFPTPYVSVPDAAGFVAGQGFQSVGIALGTAVGLGVARPDRVPLVFIGDGGTLMQFGELDSLIAQRIPAIIAVYNDGAYGAEVHHFGPMGYTPEFVQFGERDLAGAARALGSTAATVRNEEQLKQAISAWRLEGANGPLVLDCKVNPAVRAERLDEAFQRH